jgi:hypothetical protein
VGTIQILGVPATTRRMDAYGGFQFSVAEVKAVAERLRTGRMEVGLKHDPRLNLDARVIDAGTVTLDDGHTAAYMTLEVDEDEWKRHDCESLGGFSVSVNRPFIRNSNGPAVSISADAHWFSDQQIEAAYDVFARQDIGAVAYRLYQFSDVPTILVTLTFITQQVSTIPAGLLCNYIYDSLKNFIGGGRPASRIVLKFDPQTGKATEAHIETSSEEVMRAAIDKLPEMISSNSSYEYSDKDDSWKRLES